MKIDQINLFLQRAALSLAGALLVLHAIFPHHHDEQQEHADTSVEDAQLVLLLQDLFDVDLGDEHLEYYLTEGHQSQDIPMAPVDFLAFASSTDQPIDLNSTPAQPVEPPDEDWKHGQPPLAQALRGPPTGSS